MLEDDSVLLTDLGIVNGDLIYIVPNTEQHGDVLSNQAPSHAARDDLPTNENQLHDFRGVEHGGDPAQVNFVHFKPSIPG